MPYLKGKLKGQLTAPELRRMIKEHNKLMSITIPPKTDRDGLIKLINDNGYKVNHEKQKLTINKVVRKPNIKLPPAPTPKTAEQKAQAKKQKDKKKIEDNLKLKMKVEKVKSISKDKKEVKDKMISNNNNMKPPAINKAKPPPINKEKPPPINNKRENIRKEREEARKFVVFQIGKGKKPIKILKSELDVNKLQDKIKEFTDSEEVKYKSFNKQQKLKIAEMLKVGQAIQIISTATQEGTGDNRYISIMQAKVDDEGKLIKGESNEIRLKHIK